MSNESNMLRYRWIQQNDPTSLYIFMLLCCRQYGKGQFRSCFKVSNITMPHTSSKQSIDGIGCDTVWWLKSCTSLQGFIHPRWCKISAINRTIWGICMLSPPERPQCDCGFHILPPLWLRFWGNGWVLHRDGTSFSRRTGESEGHAIPSNLPWNMEV